jgi:hypothetical protein
MYKILLIYTYVVHLLVWIINCTACMVCTSRYVEGRVSFQGATAPTGPGTPQYRGFTITLRHTTVGGTPLDE